MQLDRKALEAACEAYDAVASSNPRVAYAVSVGMKRAIRAYLQAVQPVPVVTDEMTRQAKKQIILAMQLYDFGSVSEDGSFTCSSQQIELLENRAEVAAHQALTAALTTTASAEPVALQPIETAPKDETWIMLFGDLYGEPHGHVGFWSEDDADWFDSEAASKSLTAFGWKPTHWCPFDDPLPAQGGKADD